MGPVQESEAKRAGNVGKMLAQLEAWMTEIDQYDRRHRVGHSTPHETAHEKDEYDLQVARVRTRHKSVSIRLEEFRVAPMESAPWGNFRAGIADEWTTLETGVRNLGHGLRRAAGRATLVPGAGANTEDVETMGSGTAKAVKVTGAPR